MSSEENKATVEKMWTALSQFDFETLKSCLHPDVFYEDVPTEDSGALGPENVVKRLSVAWDHICLLYTSDASADHFPIHVGG